MQPRRASYTQGHLLRVETIGRLEKFRLHHSSAAAAAAVAVTAQVDVVMISCARYCCRKKKETGKERSAITVHLMYRDGHATEVTFTF